MIRVTGTIHFMDGACHFIYLKPREIELLYCNGNYLYTRGSTVEKNSQTKGQAF
jgi:hypothetical protein